MESLQRKASEWSGVAASDAFAIDKTNLFENLGGIQPFVDLCTNFYTRVFDDEEEWFRSIFADSKKEDAIRNLYEFLVQRMGGPPLYSQRKGTQHTSLLPGMKLQGKGKKSPANMPQVNQLPSKNGIYINLVKDVRDAFEGSELVKVNCQGMHASDYKKLGAKLKVHEVFC
ncbi:hypothetical protein COCNU_03G016900 [Cocos nucifera]|uniref:Uncharacterized protein n=1 Tax=Cocos nucifera TaxID=13894 RepID=A0A8K0I570_COCNU|nr:hypothetical protein COCNU_03G016900 [Cocos nucifera]